LFPPQKTLTTYNSIIEGDSIVSLVLHEEGDLPFIAQIWSITGQKSTLRFNFCKISQKQAQKPASCLILFVKPETS